VRDQSAPILTYDSILSISQAHPDSFGEFIFTSDSFDLPRKSSKAGLDMISAESPKND
jgi:hypothetical protein